MDYERFINKFWNAFSIPVQLYEGDRLLCRFAKDSFWPDPALFHISPYLHNPHTISFIVSPDYLMVGLIRIVNTNKYLIVGPAAPFKYSRTNILSILNHMNISPERDNELQLAFHYLPQIGQNSFGETLSFLSSVLNPEVTDEPVRISFKPTLNFKSFETQTIESSYSSDYSIEKRVLTYIENGRTEELKKAIKEINDSSMSVAKLADNIIRSMKNTAIGSIAISARAAIAGGLSYHIAMTLTDFYISKVEDINNYNEISELIMTMMLDFAQRTERINLPQDVSEQLREVYRMIDEHLYSKISSRDLAEAISISQAHLCHLFKKETGITLTNYIHQRKIKEACYLLETTDLSIIDIANQLAYSSQQHFHKVFKQQMGMTPKNYIH